MNIIQCIAALLLIVLVGPLYGQATNEKKTSQLMHEAIKRAGEQRMLSQRMVMDYALVGQGKMLSAVRDMNNTITQFDENLRFLEPFVQTPQEKKILGKINRLWFAYQLLVKTKPNISQAPQVNAIADKMLKFSGQLVQLLEQRAGSTKGRLINIADRQRMLSQRIAKFYVFKAWGLDNETYQKEYRQAVDEFSRALKTLQEAPENTPEIEQALRQVAKDWKIFKISFNLKGKRFVPSLVARALGHILQQMTQITRMYVAIH